MIKVLIVDDQEIIRESLAFMLGGRPNISVIGTAENGQEAIRQVRTNKPDIVLMDIRMPGMDGIESMKIIKEYSAETKVLILTTFDDDQYIYDALKNGANGFLLKGVKLDELVKSIETVVSGGASLESSIGSKVLELFSQMAKADIQFNIQEEELNELNKNELKIIQHIGQGMSNKEISDKLNFTEGTVRNYISSILKKLELRDRTQIAIFAIQSSIMVRTIED
jgi:DNA-binding NarL/FixJ family response regulator